MLPGGSDAIEAGITFELRGQLFPVITRISPLPLLASISADGGGVLISKGGVLPLEINSPLEFQSSKHAEAA